MAVQYIDNLDYRGKKGNFGRDQFATLADMAAFSESDIDEGHLAVCLEDGKRYEWKSANAADETTGRWREYTTVGITEVTHAELAALRDAGGLAAGAQYRITDYVATTAAANTMSAGHQFDIIVTALSGSVLGETAMAALHDGDTYFANAKLEAWELSYSLDNDTTRFDWADEENGKGVVYRLKDEWNNDCPYDFKGIMFKRWKITATTTAATDLVGYYYAYATSMSGFTIDSTDYIWAYTFNINDGDGGFADASLCLYADDPTKNNRIEEYSPGDKTTRCLNNIVFGVYIDDTDDAAIGNTFGKNCRDMTFGLFTVGNSFGYECYGNSFAAYCSDNSFGNSCLYNSFGYECYNNSLGNECSGNSFGYSSCGNSLGNECSGNSFGYSSCGNSLGNECLCNSFEAQCSYNMLDSFVRYINLTSEDDADTYGYIQFVHVCGGVLGSYKTKKEVSVSRNLAYQTEVKAAGSVVTEV